MKRLFFLFAVCLPILGLANSTTQQRDSLQKRLEQVEGKDKLNVYNKLMATYQADNDTLFMIAEELDAEAARQGNTRYQAMLKANLLIFLMNAKMYDEVFQKAPEYIKFIEQTEHWLYYYYAHSFLAKSYLLNGEPDKAVEVAEKMYEHAKGINDVEGMALAYNTMAFIYKHQERYEEYEKYIRKYIEVAEGNEKLLSSYTTAWFELSQTLMNRGRYDEVLEILPKYEKANQDFDQYTGYTVLSSWSNYWSVCAKLYSMLNEYDKAEYYCDQMDEAGVNSPTSRVLIYNTRARILNYRKQYTQALEMINKAIEMNQGDYSITASGSHEIRMKILSNMGRGDDAFEDYKWILNVGDSIRSSEYARQVDELNTKYEVDRHIAEKKNLRQRWIIAFVACTLALVALLIFIIYSRRLARKNRSLYNQVQELKSKEKAVESCLLARPEETLSKEIQLYRRLNQVMRREKYFTDPNLSRKKLADELGSNEMYLAEAIKAGMGGTYSAYLSSLRLQYALELLDNNSEMTLDGIALDSGHGSYSQFFRSFSKKYGITPSEYRRLAKKR
ncbi:helix-turn-helix domain-containing protein [Bacteroidales bacterium OttesenSCG-928-L03]|nr:helix-turn-helix domain-containing protein [Bacteroidales bacterium OttesenSCG-928-L03]